MVVCRKIHAIATDLHYYTYLQLFLKMRFSFSWLYRLVGMLQESEVVLTQALEIYREVCGEVSEEVADTLTVLSATYNSRGTHNESRYYNTCIYMPAELPR